jgi:hypothetical protein
MPYLLDKILDEPSKLVDSHSSILALIRMNYVCCEADGQLVENFIEIVIKSIAIEDI